MNQDFLHLLLFAQSASSQRWQAQLGLQARFKSALLTCDDDALARMASCGLPLFNAAFQQPEVWQRLQHHSARIDQEQRHAALIPRTDTALQRICIQVFEGVLFFAWHLAQQGTDTTRLLLGMVEETSRIIATFDIWQCQFIACQHSNLLVPRWRRNPHFWSDLIGYGRSADTPLLHLVNVLGTQLLAQDLEPQTIARLSRTDAE